MSKMPSKVFNALLKFFLTGLALVAPIFLTTWVIYFMFTSLSRFMNLESLLIGFIIFIAGIIFIGYLASSVVITIIWKNVEAIFLKIPLIGQVYKATKDVTSAFVGSESKFSEPVRVEMIEGSLFKFGFVTNGDLTETLGELNLDENETYCLVYFPLSFSLSGDLFMVPKSRITPLDKKAKDVMQTIVSGGLIRLDK